MGTLQHAYDVLSSSGMKEGLPDEQVGKLLCQSQRCEDTGKRFQAYYLVEMDERRLYQSFGCSSTRHFAEQHMDQDHRRTSELLQVGRALLTLPAIDAAFCNHEISWSKLRCLVRVVVPKHEAAWLEKARALSCKALSRDVLLSKEGAAPRKPGQRKGLAEIRYPVRYSLDVIAHEKCELAMRKLSDEFGHQLTGPEFMSALCDMALSSTPDGSIPGRTPVNDSLYKVILNQDNEGLSIATADGPMPIDAPAQVCDAECEQVHGELGANGSGNPKDRKTPTWLRIAVIQRDGGRCRHCDCTHSLMVHHIVYREDGGPTKASNLITLCERCHGLVHEGLILIDGETAKAARLLEVERHALTPPAHVGSDRTAHVRRVTVTLNDIPDEIDGAWWDAHSHLLDATRKGLTFAAGESAIPSEAVPNGARAPRARPSSLRLDVTSGITFEDFEGQDRAIQNLSDTARVRREDREPFPHTLLSGPAGTGKTTMARAIASSMDAPLIEAQCPLLQSRLSLLGLLCQLREGDALFLDEIHALPRPLMETLYQAMAERCVMLTLRDGLASRSIRLTLPRFTLLAATTEDGELTGALTSRFGIHEQLVRYGDEAISRIATRAASRLGVQFAQGAALALARAARGIPRQALRLLARVHDQAKLRKTSEATVDLIAHTLRRQGYDDKGHTPAEQRYLEVLGRSVGPMPLHRICALMGQSTATVTGTIEPHLFETGLVATSRNGRRLVERHTRVSPASASTYNDYGSLNLHLLPRCIANKALTSGKPA